jgi:hypothetical protein
MAKARILVATSIAGIAVASGAAVEADDAIIRTLVAIGEADDHPDAVAYAEETFGTAIKIPSAAAPTPVDDADDEIDLENLTKAQLVELAAQRFGLALDQSSKKDDLIAAIVEAAKTPTA